LVNICRFADALNLHPAKLFDFYKKPKRQKKPG